MKPAKGRGYVQVMARRALMLGDLQALVERAGGYQHITAEEWAEFDRQRADWEARRRAYLRQV